MGKIEWPNSLIEFSLCSDIISNMFYKHSFAQLVLLVSTIFVLNSSGYSVTNSYETNEASLEKAKHKDVPLFKIAKKKTLHTGFFQLRISFNNIILAATAQNNFVNQLKTSDLYWTSSGLSPPV